jgi:Protein of unknown function (DUF1612)/HTH DNA binding domain
VTSPAETVFFALARAEDAVSRLDEIVRVCPFADGWTSRLDFTEAVAWGWNNGSIITHDDLLLHDGMLDAQLPEAALVSARGLLRARRRARLAGSELLSAAGISWLAGSGKRPPLPGLARPLQSRTKRATAVQQTTRLDGLVASLEAVTTGVSDTVHENLAEWLTLFLDRDLGVPHLLHAAFGLEAWAIIDPLPRRGYLGPVLIAQWLHAEHRFRSGMLGIEGGVRARSRQGRGKGPPDPLSRLSFWLNALADGAAAGVTEIQRLTLARSLLERRTRGRRASSKLPEAIVYVMGRPLVTAGDLATALKISGTSARRLLEQLSPTLKEVSGRSHYRAWRL